MLLVTGGYSNRFGPLSTTEVSLLGQISESQFNRHMLETLKLRCDIQVAVYYGGSHLEWWREVEGGQLPLALFGLHATVVDQTLYVSGGYQSSTAGLVDYQSSILSWDPVTESWQPGGDLVVGRGLHAAVAIPRSTIAMYCKQKN